MEKRLSDLVIPVEQDLASRSVTSVPSVAAVKQALDNLNGQAAGDDLGNHTATQNLNLNGHDLVSSSGIVQVDGQLRVYNVPNQDALYFKGGPGGAGSRAALAFDATGVGFGSNVSARINFVDDGAYGANILLETRTGSGGTDTQEQMRVQTNGNVGIGTSTPSQKLEVAGSVKAQQFLGDGSQVTGVVHQAGEEVIAGGKTFTQPQHFADLDAETGAVVGQVDVSGHGVVFGPGNPRVTWQLAATGDDNLEVRYSAHAVGLTPSFKICPTNPGDDSSAVEMRTLKAYVAANTSQVTVAQDLKSDSTTSVPSVHAVNTAPLSNYAIGSAYRAIAATDTAKSAIGVLEYKLNTAFSSLDKLMGNNNFGFCLGGEYSSVSGSYSAVLGGHDNTISGFASIVGASNQVTLNANFTAAFGFSSSLTVPAWVTNGVVAPIFWLQAGANGSNSTTYFYKLSASSYGGLLFNGAPAALRFRGDWATQTFYAKHDVVIYNGVTYLALSDQTDAQNSAFNSANWKPWATGTAPVSTALKSTVSSGTFGSGELQGTQPGGSLPGMRFVDATYRYEYQLGMNDTNGTNYVWVRTTKA